MAKTIAVAGTLLETEKLASFSFWMPSGPAADPPCGGSALLRIVDHAGKDIVVRGADAITLEVLLGSFGIEHLSGPWNPDTFPDSGMLS